MTKFRILTLTDHSGHSKENSIYALLRELRLHKNCADLFVASRGSKENSSFFEQLDKNKLFGRKVPVNIEYQHEAPIFTTELSPLLLADFDILFLRLPRPISNEFLLWLKAEFAHGVVINDPAGIIETSNKAFLQEFPDLCPPIKLCHSIAEVMEMAELFPIVLKPLEDYGGRGLLKIDGNHLDDGNTVHDTSSYLRGISNYISTEGYLAMKYLKNVTKGDKRILVVGGEIMASSLRLPPADSWLCNVARGGKSVGTTVTKREKEIIAKVSPILLEKGIFIFGADTLVDDDGQRILSELNTLSIGGFPQAEAQTGMPIIKQSIDKFFQYATAKL